MNALNKLVVATSSALATVSLFSSTVLAQYDYEYSTSTTSDGEAAAAGFIIMLVWCAILCIPLIIVGGMTWWVYKDATKRNNENAVLWAVLTFFTGLIGFIIYLVTQRDNNPSNPNTTSNDTQTVVEGEATE